MSAEAAIRAGLMDRHFARLAARGATISGDPLSICSKCETPHADNCGFCFGWGVRYPTDLLRPDEGCPMLPASPNDSLENCERCRACGGFPTGRIATAGPEVPSQYGSEDRP